MRHLKALLFATFCASISSPSGAQYLMIQFDIYEDAETLERSLKLDFRSPRDGILVTHSRRHPAPEGPVRVAFESLLVELLGGGIDLASVDFGEFDEGPHTRLTIEIDDDDNHLAYSQRLMLDRLPLPALQLMQIFRAPGDETAAFMAQLAQLQARHPSRFADEMAQWRAEQERRNAPEPPKVIAETEILREDLRDARDRLNRTQADLADARRQLRQLKEESVAEAVAETAADAVAEGTKPAARPTTMAALADAERRVEAQNAQIAALRVQLGELQALLDQAAARDTEAQIRIQELGAALNQALAQVAAEQAKDQ